MYPLFPFLVGTIQSLSICWKLFLSLMVGLSMSPMHGDGIDTEAAHEQSHMFCPDMSICVIIALVACASTQRV